MEDIKPIDKFTLDKYVKEEDELKRRHLIDSSNAALLYFAIFLLHNHSL